jgi:hypothetical protein
MDSTELVARTRTALTVDGLSLCEHFVMCSVGYRVNVDPAALVRHARGVSEGDPRGGFTEAEYHEALERCLRRGLLKVLGADDFDGAGRRLFLRNTPLAAREAFDDYAPGHVEFTAEGLRVHLAALQAIFGDDSVGDGRP